MKIRRQEADAILRASLGAFVYEAYFALTGKRLEQNWHIDALCWSLQHLHLPRYRHHLVVNMPPRSLKSFICSICYPAWRFGLDPTLAIIVASYGEELSKPISRQCRELLGTTFYRRLFPRTRVSRRKDTETEFESTLGGSRFATTVGGALTGRGCDLLIVDDPIKVQDSFSEIVRNNVVDWFNGTAMTRLNEPTKSQVVVVMHRLHAEDLAGVLIEQGHPKLVVPAVAEEPARYVTGPRTHYRRKRNEVLQKRMGSLTNLLEIKQKLGSHVYAGQYQQNPLPAEGNLMRREWLKRYGEPPARFDRMVITCDPALKHESHHNYTAVACVGILEKTLYFLEVARGHWSIRQIAAEISRMAMRHGVDIVIVEDTAAGPGVRDEFLNHHLSARAWKVKEDKTSRLTRQLPKFECEQVFLPVAAPWLAEFERELLSFPNCRNDDQVDAALIAFEYYDEIKAHLRPSLAFGSVPIHRRSMDSFDLYGWQNNW